MVTHQHSTLSDEGIEDYEIREMESQRPGDQLSHGSIGAPSSPAPASPQEEVQWEFREDAPLHEFSSAQPIDEQLPETVPIPSQQEELRDAAINSTEKRGRLDFSETCSTARRSSPYNIDHVLDQPWDFIQAQSAQSRLSLSEEEGSGNLVPQQSDKASKYAKAPPQLKSEQQQKRPYNTRSRPNISYADGGSSSDEDDDSEAGLSPDTASRARAQETSKNASPANGKAAETTTNPSPNNQQSEERVESESPRTAERKRRQRPKTPLPIDDETQRVPTALPATPPVTDQRPKKRQRRQPKRPSTATKSKSRTRNKQPEGASPVARPNTAYSKLVSHQPAQVSSNARDENRPAQRHEPAYPTNVDKNDEEQEGSSVEESAHSTKMTTPSVLPSPQRISCMQALAPPCKPLPPPPSPPLAFEDLQDSVESIPAARPPFIGDLSILTPRNVSRRDEEISHRLQEIHKASRIGLYFEDKEREIGSVSSVYRKNGTGVVERLQRRFAKEHQSLLRKLQEDSDTFNKSLGAAKRSVREGARDRQRILKELDRNAKKRQHSCSNEVNRIKDIAKRLQIQD